MKPTLTLSVNKEILQRAKSIQKNTTLWYAAIGSGAQYQLILLLVANMSTCLPSLTTLFFS